MLTSTSQRGLNGTNLQQKPNRYTVELVLVASLASLDYVADGWCAQFERSLAAELQTIKGVHPSSRRGQAVLESAVRTVEALIAKILSDLCDPDSGLFIAVSQVCDPSALEQATTAVAGLVRQGAMRRSRRVVLAALAALGAFTGGLALSAAEDAGQAVFHHFFGEGEATRPLEDLAETCRRLERLTGEAADSASFDWGGDVVGEFDPETRAFT